MGSSRKVYVKIWAVRRAVLLTLEHAFYKMDLCIFSGVFCRPSGDGSGGDRPLPLRWM